MLELVGLQGFGQRDVNALSGGEQQRVALARSLAPQPRLLMLDEPLGSLDRSLRERLMVELRQILKDIHQTAIYVTHDQEEAFALADRIAVVKAGHLEQLATPQIIYSRPASPFVARFLGMTNLLEGVVRHQSGGNFVETAVGVFPIESNISGQVTLLLRPDSVRLDGVGSMYLQGKLVDCSFRGGTCQATVEIQGVLLKFDFLASTPLPGVDETVRLSFEPSQALQIFSPA
jgi:ABC-type Fe3+/spermidine/putrescine transport system ATPase subunit